MHRRRIERNLVTQPLEVTCLPPDVTRGHVEPEDAREEGDLSPGAEDDSVCPHLIFLSAVKPQDLNSARAHLFLCQEDFM